MRRIALFLVLLCFILIQISVLAIPPDSLWLKGVEYIRQSDYVRGIESMEEVIKLNPSNGRAYNNLAMCNYYLGDMESVCSNLKAARAYSVNRNKGLLENFCNETKRIENITKIEYSKRRVFPVLGYRPKYTRADTLRGALRIQRTCFDVLFYDLRVRILPATKRIEGENKIRFKALEKSQELQLDLFSHYSIDGISMQGKKLEYRREYDAVFVQLPYELVPGKEYLLSMQYSGKPSIADNPPWFGGFVWSRDKRFNRWAGVACEQLGASSWWPNKDHLSDRPDSMAIHIEVPSRFQAIANGSFRGVERLEKGFSRYNWYVSYPINNYNVTFYMGKYDQFEASYAVGEDSLQALYHVMPYNKEKAIEHFKQSAQVLQYYSKAFGPYPFPDDKFRMVESPYEGMEHQSAIAYGAAYDNKKNSMGYLHRDFDYIIVHEAAHEWWGNSVAAADMADIWLHEGFATYAEYLFLEELLGYSESVKEIGKQMRNILNVWPMVQNRDVNENAFAGQDVYVKGAALLHCLRVTLNHDSLFKAMLHDFHLAFRDTTIQSDDFIEFVTHYTGHDFSALFNIFLYETHSPELNYSYKRRENDIILTYAWGKVDKEFQMPFSIEVIGSGESYRLEGTTKQQEIILKNAESFRFYNLHSKLDNCPHNGFTYFSTKKTDM